LKRNVCRSDFGAIAAAMNVEFDDKPWFYQTMTSEQAEQRLKRASDGVLLDQCGRRADGIRVD
jgi:hypothetical protein